jgi:hypothetical protein
MAENDFDQASRYTARHLAPPTFFRWLMGAGFVGVWDFDGWLDTQAVPFPGLPDRRCDTVAGFVRRAGDHRPLALVIEFMSQTRRVTLRRLTQYGLQVQEDCPYEREPRVEYSFAGAVVNLTGGEQADVLEDRPPDTGDLGLLARYRVRTLANESAEALLAEAQADEQLRPMLVWCPLMQGADTAEFVGRWRTEVDQERDDRVRGDVVGLALVFAELVKRRPLWQRGVEGMNVERSQVVLEWEQRGELRERRTSLLELLDAKFAESLPAELRQKVEAEEDLAILRSWFRSAATAASLEALQAEWGRNGS